MVAEDSATPIMEVWAERNFTPSMISKFPSAVMESPILRGARRRESAAGMFKDAGRLVSGHRTSPVPSAEAGLAGPTGTAGMDGGIAGSPVVTVRATVLGRQYGKPFEKTFV